MQRDTAAEIARLDERIKALDRLLEERQLALRNAFVSSEKAIDKAEGAQLRVNAAQNEFRGALSDQTKTMASRIELDGLDKRVQAVERTLSSNWGHSGGVSSAQDIIFKVLPLLIAIGAAIAVYLKR